MTMSGVFCLLFLFLAGIDIQETLAEDNVHDQQVSSDGSASHKNFRQPFQRPRIGKVSHSESPDGTRLIETTILHSNNKDHAHSTESNFKASNPRFANKEIKSNGNDFSQAHLNFQNNPTQRKESFDIHVKQRTPILNSDNFDQRNFQPFEVPKISKSYSVSKVINGKESLVSKPFVARGKTPNLETSPFNTNYKNPNFETSDNSRNVGINTDFNKENNNFRGNSGIQSGILTATFSENFKSLTNKNQNTQFISNEKFAIPHANEHETSATNRQYNPPPPAHDSNNNRKVSVSFTRSSFPKPKDQLKIQKPQFNSNAHPVVTEQLDPSSYETQFQNNRKQIDSETYSNSANAPHFNNKFTNIGIDNEKIDYSPEDPKFYDENNALKNNNNAISSNRPQFNSKISLIDNGKHHFTTNQHEFQTNISPILNEKYKPQQHIPNKKIDDGKLNNQNLSGKNKDTDYSLKESQIDLPTVGKFDASSGHPQQLQNKIPPAIPEEIETATYAPIISKEVKSSAYAATNDKSNKNTRPPFPETKGPTPLLTPFNPYTTLFLPGSGIGGVSGGALHLPLQIPIVNVPYAPLTGTNYFF